MNPRYIAYAMAQGSASPEEQMAKDAERYPGGRMCGCADVRMCGFILWMAEQWRDWRAERGIGPNEVLFDADHADFDSWLSDRVESLSERIGRDAARRA